MGKYGSGVSMKTVIGLEVGELQSILDRSNLSKEDKDEAVSILKEMAYQWCHTNAFACALEEVATEGMTKDEYIEFGKKVMNSPTVHNKMAETFPF